MVDTYNTVCIIIIKIHIRTNIAQFSGNSFASRSSIVRIPDFTKCLTYYGMIVRIIAAIRTDREFLLKLIGGYT